MERIVNKHVDLDQVHVLLNHVEQQQQDQHSVFNTFKCQTRQLFDKSRSLRSRYFYGQVLTDLVWEKLNTGHWSQVDLAWRQLYSIVTLARVTLVAEAVKDARDVSVLEDSIKMCDMGLLMGAPVLDNIFAHLASELSLFAQYIVHEEEPPFKRSKTNEFVTVEDVLGKAVHVQSVHVQSELSLESFVRDYKSKGQPVVIKDMLHEWPATHQWSVEYIRRVAGRRTVPVEIGRRYTDNSWTQTLMTVNQFIDEYVEKQSSVPGYLAQHELFDQIEELRQDFDVPPYCYTGEDEHVAVNVWFGPGGTVSPLHTDPKHNCLCQVFGHKYVRLYVQDQTDHLYPHDSATEALLSNTSRIDLEQDWEDIVQEFPDFAKAAGYECVLQPGDILYIPPQCWHFVKSLSQSCSLSFWFV